MSGQGDKLDLTRWNRSGLRRVRYVQGNAAEYLEQLREALAQRFPHWASIVQTGGTEDELLRQKRVLRQYHAERQDFGWEIARSFARACHVLTEHVDAFANEGFIETATQWDLARRLVEMLGYQPAPPSSATSVVVLRAKSGAVGTVGRGLSIKYSPTSGEAPVVFETLDDLEIDYRLDALRPYGWKRSEAVFDPFSGADPAEAAPFVASDATRVSAGQTALLLQQDEPGLSPLRAELVPDVRVVKVASVRRDSGAVVIAAALSTQVGAAQFLRGFTQLLLAPAKVRRPKLNGPDVIALDRAPGLARGETLAFRRQGAWSFNTVEEAVDAAVRVRDANTLPQGSVYRAAVVHPVYDDTRKSLVFRAPLTLVAAAYRNGMGVLVNVPLADFAVGSGREEQGFYRLTKAIDASELLIVNAAAPAVAEVVSEHVPTGRYVFDGAAGELSSGDWVLAEYEQAGLLLSAGARVERIEAREDSFLIELKDAAAAFALGVDGDELKALIRGLRRIEALLDQPMFEALSLQELEAAEIEGRPVSAIQGIGPLNAHPPSFADKLAARAIGSVGELARLDPAAQVQGIPSTLLREFRTHAEQLLRASSELALPRALRAMRLPAIVALETQRPGAAASSTRSLVRMHGPFRLVLRPTGYDRNALPLTSADDLLLSVESTLPAVLARGRSLLVEQELGDGFVRARQAVVTRVDGKSLGFSPAPAAADGFTLGNTVIRANVVRAGHGERKGERVLGSGNAALLNQEFVLDVSGVSFVADASMPAGVRADISVSADGQIWQQVASLRDSKPADPHYTVALTERGHLRIAFGDGENGRRLPTGTNNVRVQYRVGNGLVGNLGAGSLQKLAKPHALVDSVRQPLPAAFGNDFEGVAALRSNAPASLLALERAVSPADFANLAMSQSSVWQARAFTRATALGRQENIEVVIVPAGGAPLDDQLQPVVAPTLIEQQRLFLESHCIPGVAVRIAPFEPVLIDLEVSVQVQSAQYDPVRVVAHVRAALIDAFALARRPLGKALQRGEVYRVVEEVEGVENSVCKLRPLRGSDMASRPVRVVWLAGDVDEPSAQSIIVGERQVVYLDPARSVIEVEAKEYEL